MRLPPSYGEDYVAAFEGLFPRLAAELDLLGDEEEMDLADEGEADDEQSEDAPASEREKS